MSPELSKLIDAYAAAPAALAAAVAGMSPEQLRARPIPGKWSVHEVVCHLADFEPLFVDRAKRIVAENEPTIFGGDPDLFAAKLNYDARDTAADLALILACRKHMTPFLRSLSDADFQRRGNHSEAGLITLEKLLQTLNAHIPHHLAFVEEKRAALGLPRS